MHNTIESKLVLNELLTLNKVEQSLKLAEINVYLEELDAKQKVIWALEKLERRVCCIVKFWYSSCSDASFGN